MKEFRFRIFIILLAIGLSVYLLYPTYKDAQNNKDIKKKVEQRENLILSSRPEISPSKLSKELKAYEDSLKSDPDFKKVRMNRMKLGLDLQGGMYIVMEVNTAKLLEKLAEKKRDEIFDKALAESEKESKISDEDVVDILARTLKQKGVELRRYFGSIRESESDVISNLKKETESAVTRAIQIIRNRVDQYGVSEPGIQQQGSRRIIVELPGVAKEEEAKQLLQGRALLEFRLVKEADFTYRLMEKIDQALAVKSSDSLEIGISEKTTSDSEIDQDSTTQEEQLSEEEWRRKHPFFSLAMINPQSQYADAYVIDDNRIIVEQMLNKPEIKKIIDNANVEFLFSAKPLGKNDKGQDIYLLYTVNKNPELTGDKITGAMANIDPQTSSPIVNMEMNSEGAREWARITGANINKRCAIVLDGVIYSAPNIMAKISGGNSQISGIGSMDEAKLLEIVLKAGALPAPIDIIEERTVGPSLGQDSVSAGFNSAMYGFILVAIFMMFYYRKAGAIADMSLFFVILFILAVLAGFKATLTLPGIAGIVLTMGMAVDANVLIYERIREELKTGKTMKASIDAGFKNSYSAIIDSNITTFFTGVILYQFGSGPVQGFALTLMIGIASSLFGALVITRVIFNIMAAKNAKITVG